MGSEPRPPPEVRRLHCGSERMRGFSDEVQVYRLKACQGRP
jgi:hypothetical protein